jgi:hypothetical protein
MQFIYGESVIEVSLSDYLSILTLFPCSLLLPGVETFPPLLGKLCHFDSSIEGGEDVVMHHPSGLAFIGGDAER